MKRFVLGAIAGLVFLLQGCGGGGDSSFSSPQTDKQDTSQKDTSQNDTPQSIKEDVKNYPYIPKDINDSVAVRFLNKATFGATKKDVATLKEKGVVVWLDEQLQTTKQSTPYLKKMIEIAKEFNPKENPESVEDYLADNDIVFNKKVASFHSPTYFTTSWFTSALSAKDQLRHKTAYVLSQILVESDFEPVFTRRSEALAHYFDILYSGAFGSYGDLLYNISTDSGMALFLTFNGSKKAFKNDAGVWVFPDENYAREVMQLFSIGLNQLNLDGTPKKDKNGNLIPTYTQTDVNELARVFTGFDLKRSSSEYWSNPKDIYGLVGFKSGDFTHMVEFTPEYHDDGNKTVLGSTIQGGNDGFSEIRSAVNILMENPNAAPYIAKKLIQRFAKSNPTPSYVERVATVFKENKGDLQKVVKAILLDEELWSDLKGAKVTKFKEPLIAYTQYLRAFEAKPFPEFVFCGFSQPVDENASNCSWVKDEYSFYRPVGFLGQGAGFAPTVFNFYDDDYVPNDTNFKSADLKAPEAEIISDTVLIKMANELKSNLAFEINDLLNGHKEGDGWIQFKDFDEYAKYMVKNKQPGIYYVRYNKALLDLERFYTIVKQYAGEDYKDLEECSKTDGCKEENTKKAVAAVLDEVDKTLLGGALDAKTKTAIVDAMMKVGIYNHWRDGTEVYRKQRAVYDNVIIPLITLIATSDYYMSE